MIQITFDAAERCIVVRFLPGPNSDEEWQRGLDTLLLFDAEAARQGKDGIAFIIADSGAERPNATWRRRLAEQRKQYQAKKRYLILVTESVLFRGVLHVANWISTPSPEEENFVTKSIAEGVAKAQEWRGQPVRILQNLLEQAK